MSLEALGILFAIGLGILNALWTWRSQRVKVKVSLSLAGFPPTSPLVLMLQAVNTGSKPLVLTGYGIRFPDDPRDTNSNMRFMPYPIAQTNVTFPYELQPGHRCSVWMPIGELSSALQEQGFSGKQRIVGFFDDAAGNHWQGRRAPVFGRVRAVPRQVVTTVKTALGETDAFELDIDKWAPKGQADDGVSGSPSKSGAL